MPKTRSKRNKHPRHKHQAITDEHREVATTSPPDDTGINKPEEDGEVGAVEEAGEEEETLPRIKVVQLSAPLPQNEPVEDADSRDQKHEPTTHSDSTGDEHEAFVLNSSVHVYYSDMKPQVIVYKLPASRAKAEILTEALHRTAAATLTRLQDPQPEGYFTRGLRAIKPQTGIGALAVLTCINALGLLSVAFSYYLSVLQYDRKALEFFFLAGLLLMFIPNLIRLLSSAPSRFERLSLLCVLGLYCYLVEFIVSPLHFSWFDEFLHWRTASDILLTNHLFSENSMLPVSPYYSGQEIVSNAISTMSGLDTFHTAIIIEMAARLLLTLSLFLFYEQLTESSRMASIAVLIYMTNPHFLLFDSIYNYETLGLPLAMCMLYVLTRFEANEKKYRVALFSAWIVLTALVITHHMTDYVFIGFLFCWAIVSLLQPTLPGIRIRLTSIALFGLMVSLVYALLFPGNPVTEYLSSYFGSSLSELGNIIGGFHQARPLFSSTTAQSVPLWDRLLMLGSVVIIAFALPFGLVALWQHRSNTLAVTFGFISLLYPISQVFRFTTLGGEITDRSSMFLFLPIAYVLTLFIVHFWPARKLRWQATSLIVCALSVIFLGGVIVEIGPIYQNLPGPYLVVGDIRSIEPEGVQDATWSREYLGPNNRIATDRINQLLMLTYGDQRVVTHLDDNIDIAPIFYSSIFNTDDVGIIHAGKVQYLMVDLRLSTSLPVDGIYYENDRPDSIIPRSSLTKFDTVSRLMRLFDSGNIVIYSTGVLDADPAA